MAFNPSNLTNQGHSDLFNGQGYQFYYDAGSDTKSSITEHYFDNVSQTLRKYDYILTDTADGRTFIVVTGSSSGSVSVTQLW